MQNYFGAPSGRIAAMREKLLAIEPQVCVERAVYTTEAYKEHISEPNILKRAYAIAYTLHRMTIYIEEGSLLAGNQASSDRAAPIYPEYAMDWVIEEMDLWEKRDGDRFCISEENKQILRDIYPFWKGTTLQDKALALMPPLSRKCYDMGIARVEGNITAGDGHLAVDYAKLLRVGLKGISEEVEAEKEKLDFSNLEDLKKLYFYNAILIIIDACVDFAHRYADLASEMADREKDEDRKTELMNLARVCRRVPEYPAENFYEAVQSLWFVHLILQIESNGHSLSFGRFDQFMYPYYSKDIENGSITQEFALELLENLWLKTFTINKIRSNSHTKFSAGSPMYQNVCIGGQHPDGTDAVNDLSYLVLKSVGQLKLTQPNLSEALIAFFTGWFYAILTLKYHSLRPTIAAHISTAFFLWLLDAMPDQWLFVRVLMIIAAYVITMLTFFLKAVPYELFFPKNGVSKRLWKILFSASSIRICTILFVVSIILSLML